MKLGNKRSLPEGLLSCVQKERARLCTTAHYVAQHCATVHRSELVLPSMMWAPCLIWSVFDCFRCTLTILGSCGSSTATSPHARCSRGLNVIPAAGSNSPSRKTPKKAVQHTTHRTIFSGSDEESGADESRRYLHPYPLWLTGTGLCTADPFLNPPQYNE